MRRIKTKILRDVTLRVASQLTSSENNEDHQINPNGTYTFDRQFSFLYRLVHVQHHALNWTRNAIPVFEQPKSAVTASHMETTVVRCDGH